MRKIINSHLAIAVQEKTKTRPRRLVLEISQTHAGVTSWGILAIYDRKVMLLRDLVSECVGRAVNGNPQFNESDYLLLVEQLAGLYLEALRGLNWTGA
ncbi:DUF5405 family protein [Hafnia alvei]|uniref:DUF5405 family protein n=1 Tax=Hafnia alvei TaxID=569 RepID=UPI001038CA32|nr:DUF5405 family protein [Hafnia alvei]QBJ32312.1 hypothetical protein EYZ02_04990 [Hafnia alvei]